MRKINYDYSSTIQFIGKIYDAEEITSGDIKLTIGVYFNKDISLYTAIIDKKLYDKKVDTESDGLIVFKGVMCFCQSAEYLLELPISTIDIDILNLEYV